MGLSINGGTLKWMGYNGKPNKMGDLGDFPISGIDFADGFMVC
jgi:hypothetical protein